MATGLIAAFGRPGSEDDPDAIAAALTVGEALLLYIAVNSKK